MLHNKKKISLISQYNCSITEKLRLVMFYPLSELPYKIGASSSSLIKTRNKRSTPLSSVNSRVPLKIWGGNYLLMFISVCLQVWQFTRLSQSLCLSSWLLRPWSQHLSLKTGRKDSFMFDSQHCILLFLFIYFFCFSKHFNSWTKGTRYDFMFASCLWCVFL